MASWTLIQQPLAQPMKVSPSSTAAINIPNLLCSLIRLLDTKEFPIHVVSLISFFLFKLVSSLTIIYQTFLIKQTNSLIGIVVFRCFLLSPAGYKHLILVELSAERGACNECCELM